MPRVKCQKIHCKHNISGKCNLTKITIGEDCNCKDYEIGINGYFNKVWNLIYNTNCIISMNLTEEDRIGLYYVMDCYGLGFVDDSIRGFIALSKEGIDGYLKYDAIEKDWLDIDKYHYHLDKFNQGILPPYDKDNIVVSEPKLEYQPYGFLSPMGDFYEGDWGTHEELACKILEDKNLYGEYKKEYLIKDNVYVLCRDFIIQNKGYALIHSPSNIGYIVTSNKQLTKKQKEFLYNYFSDIGDYHRAEEYLDN